MTPHGDETKAQMAAVSEEAATKAVKQLQQRRQEDSPRQHAARVIASFIYGGIVLIVGVVLRVTGNISEWTLLIFVLAAGVASQGQSILSLAKIAMRKKDDS